MDHRGSVVGAAGDQYVALWRAPVSVGGVTSSRIPFLGLPCLSFRDRLGFLWDALGSLGILFWDLWFICLGDAFGIFSFTVGDFTGMVRLNVIFGDLWGSFWDLCFCRFKDSLRFFSYP